MCIRDSAWVVIVPDGNATAHMSWKRWCFMQVHTGILGGHRSANKTMSALKRIVWWQTMHTDVETWWLRCHTCQRFRKVAQRQEAPSVIPIEAECWERVMIDIEGPSTPADLDGCIYVMTYICTVQCVTVFFWRRCRSATLRKFDERSPHVCLEQVHYR